jgi:hypothetical protein
VQNRGQKKGKKRNFGPKMWKKVQILNIFDEAMDASLTLRFYAAPPMFAPVIC